MSVSGHLSALASQGGILVDQPSIGETDVDGCYKLGS
ncbi:hypothetical protein Pla144_19260 [Bythopirellula polymerisocia]|uniref:Uncharacterized protein n=1 Tax=Bythopirellula polymerisocia TaxID=2528003 RepID=A0A5C6CYH3_9BACT|nr:hypothetical protein Pla144_19260 [Bythopirellula polymerisocia]